MPRVCESFETKHGAVLCERIYRVYDTISGDALGHIAYVEANHSWRALYNCGVWSEETYTTRKEAIENLQTEGRYM